jgi:COP9 signalosome complex subunit 4
MASELVTEAESIINDSSVVHSRPLLTAVVEKFKTQPDEVKIEAGTEIVQLLAPKIVSYEQQDTDLKFALADAYENAEDYTSSAKTLQTIVLDSSQGRNVTDDEKASVWMRICRCYLEEDDPTNAVSYLNKIKQVIHSVTDATIRLQFQLSQARINDSQRNFLDASTSYHTLSLEPTIDEEERLRALSAAITTAVLAPAGPTRARQLGRLYKDERAVETSEHGILEKIFLDRLLSPSEVSAFASTLQDHQLAKTADGSTVLEKAVLEHNLVAASRLYQNIPLESLGALLGVSADRAESYAAAMIESKRLNGEIDQIAGLVHFVEGLETKDLRTWESNIKHLSEEVEKVATLLVTA